MQPAVAIVGMACQYPDAKSPSDLWENVLAQRRAFRRIPTERLSLEDYWSSDRYAPDRTYGTEVAVIEGYEFDRIKFRVSGSTFRSADFVHWLALDIATQALADAGFIDGIGLPTEQTGVLLGNTLTGEFSRANTLRMRWPYVSRVVEALLTESGYELEQRSTFLKKLKTSYKAPFPDVGEETLAGNLSNTIAGRICNHYNLKGGGYTIDGACSSSLLAIANACAALTIGDLDVALAGGVDLSLDPFELVGFAKAGALAAEEMRIYDRRSAGFLPGEGCGFVVLMRYEDAIAQNRRIYAVIRGWGISSDGSGGITRPELEGQLLALRRAYDRAEFEAATVAYFEGHGTGTVVGDATELQALSMIRRETTTNPTFSAVISSIKAIIGHTKAAAGIAGLIKATMALHRQILPPTTGCEQPHVILTNEGATLRTLSQGELWQVNLPLRAGVSAMGFGGINTHIVLEGITTKARQPLSLAEQILLTSSQDAELLLFGAKDETHLLQEIEHLLTFTPKLSRSEISDLAAELEKNLQNVAVRAAIVAGSPTELTARLEILRSHLLDNALCSATTYINSLDGVFLGTGTNKPKIGFLFPGQAAPSYLNGGAWERRFKFVREIYQWTSLSQPVDDQVDGKATVIAQPAIVTASIAALRTLNHFGINAQISVGHSLGEISALYWAGALDKATVLKTATMRGQIMTMVGHTSGGMASIQAAQSVVQELIDSDRVVIAGLNSPKQTVIAGEMASIAAVVKRAETVGLKAVSLPVSHAFHSPLMVDVVQPLATYLNQETLQPLQRKVVSTVTGRVIEPTADLRSMLCDQVTAPVRFIEAITTAAQEVDLFIEVGPGQILSGLVSECVTIPTIAMDACGVSLKGLLQAIGAAYALGADVNHAALFSDRFTRSFHLDWQPRFFVNPCELAPKPEKVVENSEHLTDAKAPNILPMLEQTISIAQPSEHTEVETSLNPQSSASLSALDLVRQLVAEKTELPLTSVSNEYRLLSDLHLNSITVSQLVVEAARSLGLAPPVAQTNYADATVAEVAQALEELIRTGVSKTDDLEQCVPSGVDAWIRTFTVNLVDCPLPQRHLSANAAGTWRVIARFLPLAKSLQEAFQSCEGSGVLVLLPPDLDLGTMSAQQSPHIDLLLEGARAVLAERETAKFVLVQHSVGGAAFARTLYLEAPRLTVCVVNVPADCPQATAWILAEAKAASGFSEAFYDASGKRQEPVLQLWRSPALENALPLGSDDVLLVTGGGKGIAAECALSLARETGVRLALLGRSQPEADAELSTNLDRMAAAGIQVLYVTADVTNSGAVRDAIAKVEASLGSITAILHGAGVNVPQLLGSLNKADFVKTLAPKIEGIRHVLASVDPTQLKLLVTFGSIIARTGLPGEADYALANEWLSHLVERFQIDRPNCRCLNLEWSIWSGVGMGDRLGRVDTLMREGIMPISPDTGIAILQQLMAQLMVQPFPSTSVVVTGRFGDAPTLKMEKPELPFLRFLEQTKVYYPGVELVVDVELSGSTDPYLNDHVCDGERIFPAVMGLEAMAQVAMALAETEVLPIFEEVKFNRPIVVSESAPLKIRIAALVRSPARIDVVLRSEQSGFHVDHFRATCCFGQEKLGATARSLHLPDPEYEALPILLDPERDLYGEILFHRGRFRRLQGYRKLMARECLAEIAPDKGTNWFSRYLPANLTMGDPAVRDAAIHALQACIPHATILPIGVDRVVTGVFQSSNPHFVYAREREQIGDIFIYKLEVSETDGRVVEFWEGLRLQVVNRISTERLWIAPLLGPYIERRIRELVPNADITVVVDRDAAVERRVRSDRAIQQALGTTAPVWRRPDGKPEVMGDRNVSVAHAGDLTIAIAGLEAVACDIEPVVARPIEMWQDLLGLERFLLAKAIAQENGEDLDISATRVWCAIECLKKYGLNYPLTLASLTPDNWVTLMAGELGVVTFVLPVDDLPKRLALALTIKCKSAHHSHKVDSSI